MTISEAAELARKRLGWPPSAAPAIETFIPEALQRLYESYGKHPTKRRYTWSDPTATTVTLGSDGTADLAALSDAGLLLDLLDYGQITHPDYDDPLVPASGTGEGRRGGNYDDLFGHYFLVGTVIHTRGADGGLSGSLAFACPQVRAIADMRVQLNDEFIDLLVIVAQGQPKADVSVSAQ